MESKPFDISIQLANQNDNILTPLSVPDYSELQSGTSKNQAYISFEIHVIQNKVDKLTVKITQNNILINEYTLNPSLYSAGKHNWHWDGFNRAGMLDTKALKNSELSIEIIAQSGTVTKNHTFDISCTYVNENWVDIQVNRATNRIDVELRIELDDGGQKGVGELPPTKIRNSPAFRLYSLADPRRLLHIRRKSFADLKLLLIASMKHYWSKNVNDAAGVGYNVKVNPVESSTSAMDDISIRYNTNREWLRSSNPGSVRGIYSLFGNFVPERIAYNIGWIEYNNGWGFVSAADADKEFGETGAHELGHEILSAYGGDAYSYGHKGSSTVVSQKTKKVANGGITYPAGGNIDIMKYHNGARPRDFYLRVFASEQDVKSLLWLSRIEFE